jgi:hypothetical protein
MKEELRTRLLFNLLHVSAENPGKLITDYEKTDHPMLSILENSKKLTESMDSLSKVPGLSAIIKGLEARTAKKIDETTAEVKKAVEINNVFEKKAEVEPKPEAANQ